MNSFNLKSKIDARLEARRTGESGLALLDVLLGMAIFALIAVIAVQAMGTFRERAYVTQVTSDVKQVGVALAAEGTAPNAAWTHAAGAITVDGVNLTGANAAFLTSGTSFDDYIVCVTGNGKEASYSAATGQLVGAAGDGDCS